ncbi:MAG: DoxX family protein [Actinomycetota bacterium]|jgi:thiosulfate dehydrogenase [quinone] large subunit|nr:DoxX family protein [Actinomycetota bacterium]
MVTSLLSRPEWFAVLRIGLGLWWLESFRHKDKRAWLQRGAGITWAGSVAEKHRLKVVGRLYRAVVAPRARLMAYVIVFSELAIGLGLTAGVLTPVAAAGGLALNLVYFVLMISDWAEQGQNLMMALVSVTVLGSHAWNTWSLGHAVGLF